MRISVLSIALVLSCAWAMPSLKAPALAAQAPGVKSAAPRVELELVTEKGFPITGAHEWSRALGKLNLGPVRIRSMRPGDRPEVTSLGSKQRPSFHVIGVLTARSRLRLPIGTYRLSDIARLKKDLAHLGNTPEEIEAAKKILFGLTAAELQDVRRDLRTAVDFETKGQPAADVVRQITQATKLRVQFDAAAKTALTRAEPVYDNVQGLSTGTALAVVLRPYGLMLQPRKQTSGKTDLWITPAKRNAEAWPVGWPAEKKDVELLPVLLEYLNAEIDNFTLTETLDALQPRVKVPFLLDHNAMARHSIDPDKVTIVIPPKRIYYKSLLRKVLFQGRMKSEVLVDESDKPLLWITTVKR